VNTAFSLADSGELQTQIVGLQAQITDLQAQVSAAQTTADSAASDANTALAGLPPLQNSFADIQLQQDNLDDLTRRLHGNNAAVVEYNSLRGYGPAATQQPEFVTYILVFCDGTGMDPEVSECGDERDGFVLESEPLTEADRRSVITFTAANSPDFASIVELLTNGENDYIGIKVKPDQQAYGGGAEGPERSWFFLQTSDYSVSAHLDINDLAGFEIDKISIFIDYLGFYLKDNLAWVNLRSRIYFDLVE